MTRFGMVVLYSSAQSNDKIWDLLSSPPQMVISTYCASINEELNNSHLDKVVMNGLPQYF